MTPEERFALLVQRLTKIEDAIEQNGYSKLDGALEAVVCVLEAIEQPDASKIRYTKPLYRLMTALRDTRQGGNPELFEVEKGRGRPKDTSFEIIRGILAASASLLISWNEKPDTAGRVVARLAKAAGLSMQGHAIEAKQVLRWRGEMGGTASGLSQNVYDRLLTMHGSSVPLKQFRESTIRSLINDFGTTLSG